MKVADVLISKIKVGDRFRQDLGDLDGLISSIKEKGLVQPITLDYEYNLLAGERRLEACRKMGGKTIPAIIRAIQGELDAREIELIENVVRKDMEWQERARLEKRIYDLKREDNPAWKQEDQAKYLEQSVGATSRRLLLAEIMDAIPEIGESKTVDEAWKKYKKLEEEIVVRKITEEAGDKFKDAAKWADDHYKIGDAFKGMKKLILKNPGAAQFAEVDPPYAVELDKRKGKNIDSRSMDMYNEIEASEYEAFLGMMAEQVFKLLGDNAFCIWWYGQQWYKEVRTVLEDTGFKVSVVPAIWNKGISGQTSSPDTMLGSAYETFLVCRKGNPKLRRPGKSNVFDFAPVPPQNKIHPTEKPIELMTDILETFTFPGSIICCPFLGSGVTLRAAYQVKMNGFGWDLDRVVKRRFISQVYKDMHREDEDDNKA